MTLPYKDSTVIIKSGAIRAIKAANRDLKPWLNLAFSNPFLKEIFRLEVPKEAKIWSNTIYEIQEVGFKVLIEKSPNLAWLSLLFEDWVMLST